MEHIFQGKSSRNYVEAWEEKKGSTLLGTPSSGELNDLMGL